MTREASREPIRCRADSKEVATSVLYPADSRSRAIALADFVSSPAMRIRPGNALRLGIRAPAEVVGAHGVPGAVPEILRG